MASSELVNYLKSFVTAEIAHEERKDILMGSALFQGGTEECNTLRGVLALPDQKFYDHVSSLSNQPKTE